MSKLAGKIGRRISLMKNKHKLDHIDDNVDDEVTQSPTDGHGRRRSSVAAAASIAAAGGAGGHHRKNSSQSWAPGAGALPEAGHDEDDDDNDEDGNAQIQDLTRRVLKHRFLQICHELEKTFDDIKRMIAFVTIVCNNYETHARSSVKRLSTGAHLEGSAGQGKGGVGGLIDVLINHQFDASKRFEQCAEALRTGVVLPLEEHLADSQKMYKYLVTDHAKFKRATQLKSAVVNKRKQECDKLLMDLSVRLIKNRNKEAQGKDTTSTSMFGTKRDKAAELHSKVVKAYQVYMEAIEEGNTAQQKYQQQMIPSLCDTVRSLEASRVTLMHKVTTLYREVTVRMLNGLTTTATRLPLTDAPTESTAESPMPAANLDNSKTVALLELHAQDAVEYVPFCSVLPFDASDISDEHFDPSNGCVDAENLCSSFLLLDDADQLEQIKLTAVHRRPSTTTAATAKHKRVLGTTEDDEVADGVFKSSIEQLMRAQATSHPNLRVPVVLVTLIDAIYAVENGVQAEGIFRVSPNHMSSIILKRKLNAGLTNLESEGQVDPVLAAHLIKEWLRSPAIAPVFKLRGGGKHDEPSHGKLSKLHDNGGDGGHDEKSLYYSCVDVARLDVRMVGEDTVKQRVLALFARLPESSQHVLLTIAHLLKVITTKANADVNRMSWQALSVVFAPSVLQHPSLSSSSSSASTTGTTTTTLDASSGVEHHPSGKSGDAMSMSDHEVKFTYLLFTTLQHLDSSWVGSEASVAAASESAVSLAQKAASQKDPHATLMDAAKKGMKRGSFSFAAMNSALPPEEQAKARRLAEEDRLHDEKKKARKDKKYEKRQRERALKEAAAKKKREERRASVLAQEKLLYEKYGGSGSGSDDSDDSSEESTDPESDDAAAAATPSLPTLPATPDTGSSANTHVRRKSVTTTSPLPEPPS